MLDSIDKIQRYYAKLFTETANKYSGNSLANLKLLLELIFREFL